MKKNPTISLTISRGMRMPNHNPNPNPNPNSNSNSNSNPNPNPNPNWRMQHPNLSMTSRTNHESISRVFGRVGFVNLEILKF